MSKSRVHTNHHACARRRFYQTATLIRFDYVLTYVLYYVRAYRTIHNSGIITIAAETGYLRETLPLTVATTRNILRLGSRELAWFERDSESIETVVVAFVRHALVAFRPVCGVASQRCLLGIPLCELHKQLWFGNADTLDRPNAVAYLDQDGCAAGGSETCMEIEFGLSNSSPSFVDILLIPPQTYQNAACVSFSNGCDGASLSCTEPGCSAAFTSQDDSAGAGTVLMCEEEDVNIVITFCGCDTAPVESSASGTLITTGTPNITSTTAQAMTPSSSTLLADSPLKMISTTASDSSWTTTSSTSTSTSSSPATAITTTSKALTATSSARPSSSNATGITTITSSPSSSVQGVPSAPSSTSSISSPSTSNPEFPGVVGASRKSTDHSAVIGGVLGGALAALTLTVAIFFFIRRRRRGQYAETSGQRGSEFFPRDSSQVPVAYGNGDRATTYAPISSAASPVMHSPHPWMTSPETVMDIRSTFISDYTRTVESNAARTSTISSNNPFNLPPLTNISSFSLLSPPEEERGTSSAGGSLGQRVPVTDPFDPFSDARAVDDPPPSYKG
ncbi:unnamed protein product [Peniophora sp. CBMAI 1063]|nr:unnamed protein product [Peniophora sp. CBMAI 1063]